MSDNSLANFLQSDEQDEPEATIEPVEPAEQEEPEAPAEPEVSEESEQPHSKPSPGMVPQAALVEERAKRQEAQRLLQELRSQQAPAKPAEPEEKEVDFLDDPDGWMAQQKKSFRRELDSVRQESQQRFLTLVENAAKARHSDYDEVAEVFSAAAQMNPLLAQEAISAPDPAEYVYQAGKKLKLLNDAGGDLEALLERERQKARAEALAEIGQKPNVKVPQSLTTVTASTTRSDREPLNTPLESMFNKY